MRGIGKGRNWDPVWSGGRGRGRSVGRMVSEKCMSVCRSFRHGGCCGEGWRWGYGGVKQSEWWGLWEAGGWRRGGRDIREGGSAGIFGGVREMILRV